MILTRREEQRHCLKWVLGVTRTRTSEEQICAGEGRAHGFKGIGFMACFDHTTCMSPLCQLRGSPKAFEKRVGREEEK